MGSKKRRSKRWLWVVPLTIVAVSAVALEKVREDAGGIKNALSPSYWNDRLHGEDLYSAKERYLKRGSRAFKRVLLTFDDGPHPESASLILDTLKQHHITATFFVVGKQVKLHPEIVKRMVEEGHEVGNHTQDHLRLDTLSLEDVRNELVNCEINVERASGHRMSLMRPPGMRFNPSILKVADELGYTTIGWNVAAKDFVPNIKKGDMTPELKAQLHTTPDEIAQRVLSKAKNGSIILLHDCEVTAEALPRIIEVLEQEGFSFESSSEMLAELPQHVLVASNPIANGISRVAHHSVKTNPAGFRVPHRW